MTSTGIFHGNRPSIPLSRHTGSCAALLAAHVVFCLLFLGSAPWDEHAPLAVGDHPVHIHRVHVYREALRAGTLPWGCNPAVSAGTVTTPFNDTGARMQQILGLALFNATPATVERIAMGLALLLLPLAPWLAGRMLGYRGAESFWIMAASVLTVWYATPLQAAVHYGLLSFALASLPLPVVLAAFILFARVPSWGRLVVPLVLLAGLLCLHPLSVIPLALPLAYLTLRDPALSGRWRLAVVLTALAVVVVATAALFPTVRAMGMPAPPWRLPNMGRPVDLTVADLRSYAGRWDPASACWTLARTALAVAGFLVLRRRDSRTAHAFMLAALSAYVLSSLGSEVPPLRRLQVLRYVLPGLLLTTPLIGFGVAHMADRARPFLWGAVAALAGGLMCAAFCLARTTPPPNGTPHHSESGLMIRPQAFALPRRFTDIDSFQGLVLFVRMKTDRNARILLQTQAKSEPEAAAVATGREVIGSSYPDLDDPAQFDARRLFGRPIGTWDTETFRETLTRWGIDWVFAVTPDAIDLLSRSTGTTGIDVSGYRAFRIESTASRFLEGRGRVRAQVNRIELSDVSPENGRIVLRYRYHPAWSASDGTPVLRHPVPESPDGFIELANPGGSLVLTFSPWAMLRAPWPGVAIADRVR